jgi:hypothetical protein
MKGRQLVAVLVALGLISILSVGVAWADPSADNPNVQIFTDVVCDDGTTMDVAIHSSRSSAALDTDSITVGVAKSIYFDPGGANILLVERGIQGNPLTVWCEWDAAEGHFGGDILLTPVD